MMSGIAHGELLPVLIANHISTTYKNHMNKSEISEEYCLSCVYYPPNLPAHAYSLEDFQMLQQKSCSFDHQPEDKNCQATRKTSCSLVVLDNLKKSV